MQLKMWHLMKMSLCFLKKKFVHWYLEIEEILRKESDNIETPNEESFDSDDDSYLNAEDFCDLLEVMDLLNENNFEEKEANFDSPLRFLIFKTHQAVMVMLCIALTSESWTYGHKQA